MADNLQTVGNKLRLINAQLQRIVPIGNEIPSIADAQAKGIQMVEELDCLNAGTPPPNDPSELIPTSDFLARCQSELLKAVQQLDPTPTFDELRRRINSLKAALGAAQAR